MTEAAKDHIAAIKEWITIIGAGVVILGSILTFMIWITGGIHPQTQIDVEGIKSDVSILRTEVGQIKAQLETMPRPSDYVQQDSHFRALDTSISGLRDEIAADEAKQAVVNDRVSRLMDGSSAPVRQPR